VAQVLQQCITLVVFSPLKSNIIVAYGLIVDAVCFAFRS
jgi:uncharacterized protein (DUF486 family)